LNQVKLAPDFTGKTIDGKPFKLSDYLGKKVIVLNFWGLGCSPCVAEIPTISKLVVKYPDVLFVAITGSINEGVKRLVKDKGFRYLQVESQDAFKKYGVVSIPRHFVIDKNGKIVFQWPGSISENSINLMEEAIEGCR
ncbi:MAG TPA: TlpA family protein disulfide reductase, partial [candidate division WOR-3 bacterium]|nr:TlpA family protein disulfide reductase [candidate division WOR-3 bacterium]